MNKGIIKFNEKYSSEERKICELLASEIVQALPSFENKLWHGGPVWFDHGNPIVGYDVLKNCVRLLFWSGQAFDEPGLTNEGSFKAAEARYTEVSQINTDDLARWLQKAVDIQYDYKNIVKRKGKLERLS